MPRLPARIRSAALLLVTALLATTACSSDPDVELGDPIELFGDPVTAVTATPVAVWGSGRALLADTGIDGTPVVVTTTGVYVLGGADTPPERIHEFAAEVSPGAIGISPAADTLIVTTSSPAQMLWFDLPARRLEHTIDLDVGAAITSMAFLPDGKGLVTSSRAGLTAWPDGALSGPITMTGVDAPTGTRAVLGDGRVVAPLAESTALAVIDDAQLTFTTLDGLGSATVGDAHSSPDGQVLAITAGEGADEFSRTDRIIVIDRDTFGLQAEIPLDRRLTAVDWTLTDTHVIATVPDGIGVWSLDGAPVTTLTPTSDRPVDRLLALDTGFAALHTDGAAAAWSSLTLETVPIEPGGVTMVHASVEPDGTTIVSVDFHGRVQRWDSTTGASLADIDSFALGSTTAVAVDQTGERIGVSTSSGTVALLDASLDAVWAQTPRRAHVDTVAFDPDSGLLLSGLAERTGEQAFDDTVIAWDPATGAERFRLGGESEDVAGCAFFYNRVRFDGLGGLMATTSHDFSISIVDTATGEAVQRIPPRPTTLLDVAFTPDGDLLVGTSDDATVIAWDTSDYTVAAEYDATMGGYLAIAMLPDSATMAAADITGAIALIDVITGERLLDFAGAQQRTTSIAVSPDGTLLAAPGRDSTIAIWSVDSGALLATLAGHTAAVTGVAFSPDGSYLASSSLDATVRTWSLAATTT